MPVSTASNEELRALFKAIYPPSVLDAMVFRMGPELPPLTRWERVRNRIARRWFEARVWVAEKIHAAAPLPFEPV